MRVLNFGSVNIDHVYAVDHFVRPGETLSSGRYQVFAGGKGFNQSIALARAGANVAHVGKIGKDGAWLADLLCKNGVDTKFLSVADEPTGHAVIQVAPDGENAIFIYGGANRCLQKSEILDAVRSSSAGDYVLVQNEINAVPDIMRAASQHGLRIVFNPAPMNEEVHRYPLDLVDLFVVNETEAQGLTNEADPDRAHAAMSAKFPRASTVITLGRRGASYFDGKLPLFQQAEPVKPVDTTAAGDTFIGYFLAELLRSGDPKSALAMACRAAAICVTRPGAADSIPFVSEVIPAN